MDYDETEAETARLDREAAEREAQRNRVMRAAAVFWGMLLVCLLVAGLAIARWAYAQTDDPYLDGLRTRLIGITMSQCDSEVHLLGLYGEKTTDASWYECVSHYIGETGRRLLTGDGFVERPWRGVAEMRAREE